MAEHPSILPDENRENASHGLAVSPGYRLARRRCLIVRGWPQRSTRGAARQGRVRRGEWMAYEPSAPAPAFSGSIFEFLQDATVTDRFAHGMPDRRDFEVGVVTGKVGGGPGLGGHRRRGPGVVLDDRGHVGRVPGGEARAEAAAVRARLVAATTTAGSRTCRCRSQPASGSASRATSTSTSRCTARAATSATRSTSSRPT